MRWIITLISSIVLIIGGSWLYYDLVGDYRLSNLESGLTYNPEWDFLIMPQQEAILDQIASTPLTWIDQGHQVYVFGSENHPYVLKLFKFNRLKPSAWLSALSRIPYLSSYAEHAEARRVSRLEKLFQGYSIAYTSDPFYTGMLYVHLNQTTNIRKTITLIDRLGFKHSLDLDRVCFAIQERALSAKHVLIQLLDKGEIRIAKQRIRQLFDMYLSEYNQGVVDEDHNILSNTGFVDGRPLHLDIGQLRRVSQKDTLAQYKEVLRKIVEKRLTGWLKRHYPENEEEILQEIKQQLEVM